MLEYKRSSLLAFPSFLRSQQIRSPKSNQTALLPATALGGLGGGGGAARAGNRRGRFLNDRGNSNRDGPTEPLERVKVRRVLLLGFLAKIEQGLELGVKSSRLLNTSDKPFTRGNKLLDLDLGGLDNRSELLDLGLELDDLGVLDFEHFGGLGVVGLGGLELEGEVGFPLFEIGELGFLVLDELVHVFCWQGAKY